MFYLRPDDEGGFAGKYEEYPEDPVRVVRKLKSGFKSKVAGKLRHRDDIKKVIDFSKQNLDPISSQELQNHLLVAKAALMEAIKALPPERQGPAKTTINNHCCPG